MSYLLKKGGLCQGRAFIGGGGGAFVCFPCPKNHCTQYFLSLEILFLIRLTHVTPKLLTDYGNSKIKDDNLCSPNWKIC